MLLKNIASMGGLNLFRSAIQFLMNIVLAGFVSPSEYGLVVFTLPFITFISMLTDLGLSSSIVRHPDLTKQQAGGVVTLVLIAGAVCAGILAMASFGIQSATGLAGLQPIMMAMSGIVVLSIVATPPRALLERQLRYPLIARVEGGAVVFSALLSVITVFQGAGIWALVLYNGLMQTLRMVLFLYFARDGFALNMRWRTLIPMLSFGGWVMLGNILTFAARNGQNILIGIWLGAAEVGLFGLAYQFMLVPLMIIAWPASSVLLATLSRHRNEPSHFERTVCATCAVTAALSFPAMGYFVFGLQYPLTTFMSPKWHSIPSIVSWLAPLGAVQAIAAYNGVILLARGEAKLQFWAGVIGSGLTLIVFVVSLPYGLMMMVKAYVLTGVFIAAGFLVVAARRAGLSLRRILIAVCPGMFAMLAGLVTVTVAGQFHGDALWSWVGLSLLYGAVVLATFALMRNQLVSHWQELIRERGASAVVVAEQGVA
ncbi:O-antigen/teichoic acid export membrane protein [Bradyrhizobium sp. USDA 4472]